MSLAPESFIELGEVIETVMGQAPPGDACNKEGAGMIFVKAGEFQARFPMVREWTTKPLKIAKPGDALVCVVGATAGKVNLSNLECAIGRSVAAVRARAKQLDPQYLFHFLQTKVERLRAGSQGAAQGVITREMIESLSLYLPPLPEQRRIAAILDQADALRAKRREALAQLDSLTQSIFIEMFGVPGRRSKGWPAKSLEGVALEINDCPHSTPIWTDGGFICLRTSNLAVGEWNWNDTRYVSEATFHDRSKRGYVEPGDIVLSREGTVGIAAKVQSGMRLCMGQRLVQVRPNVASVLPDYLLRHLLFVLSPSRIGQFMVGSTSQHLNVKELRTLPIPVPPLALQDSFGKSMSTIQALRGKHESALTELDALFASLQHRAFAGQLS